MTHNDRPPSGAIRILTGAAFIANHVPPVWLIDGIVQRGRLYACTSLTGHGKRAVELGVFADREMAEAQRELWRTIGATCITPAYTPSPKAPPSEQWAYVTKLRHPKRGKPCAMRYAGEVVP